MYDYILFIAGTFLFYIIKSYTVIRQETKNKFV